MSTDRDIERAIASGERNQRAAGLIHNWCSHARVQKMGGIGLVEQETGLPIGHHAMVCDFAPAGGMAAWDLADAALDFHDRNCVSCDKRQAVGFPNLSEIVAERDRARAQVDAENERHSREAAEARARRKRSRDALRPGRSTLVLALLDDLEQLDSDQPVEAGKRVVEAATLAPELFDALIVDHVFELLDAGETWFVETGLELIRRLGIDGKRVAAVAIKCLGRHTATNLAATIVEERIDDVDQTSVRQAVPALMFLSRRPDVEWFGLDRQERPGPLLTVFRRFPEVVYAAVEQAMQDRRPREVMLGARVLPLLAEVDAAAPVRFVRTIAAKLIRAHLLMDEDRSFRDNDVFRVLQDGLALALRADPPGTDCVLQAYFDDASAAGEARLIGAYERLLTMSPRGTAPVDADVYTSALRRLIRVATTSSNDEVLREVQRAFHHPPDAVVEATRTMIDVLLGAAALMDDRYILHGEASKLKPPADFLENLRRDTERRQLQDLKQSFTHLAAVASAGNDIATRQFVEFLGGVDPARDGLRAVLVGELHTLMDSPPAFNVALPALYSAMMGTSTLTRAFAAQALGHLSRRRVADLPNLVFEALIPLLRDPYRIVHQSALRALKEIEAPEEFDLEMARSVESLVVHYKDEKSYQEFLMTCVELLVTRYMEKGLVKASSAEILVAIMCNVDPTIAVHQLRFMSRDLANVKGYMGLLLQFLTNEQVMRSQGEVVLRMLRELPFETVLTHKREIQAAALARREDHAAIGALIEVLTRASAWTEARELSKAFADQVPSTVRMQVAKWSADLEFAAVRYEEAVAEGRFEELAAIRGEWERTTALIERDRQEYAERRHPFRGFSPPHEGGGGAHES